MVVHRQVVVDSYSSPGTIDEQLNDVLASRIVNRVPVVILREDVASYDPLSPVGLEFKVRSYGKS